MGNVVRYFYLFLLSFIFLFALNIKANEPYDHLQASYQRRIATYDHLIEYNEREAIELENSLQSLYTQIRGKAKDVKGLIQETSFNNFLKSVKKNSSRWAQILGAAVATIEHSNELPSIEQVTNYLKDAHPEEDLENLYNELLQRYQTRLQEIERLKARRQEILNLGVLSN